MMVVLQLLLNKLHNQGIFQKTELEYPFSHFTVFSFVNPHFSSAFSKGIDKKCTLWCAIKILTI